MSFTNTKSRNKRSIYWTYFDETDGNSASTKQAKCQLCGILVISSGNSTNIANHLQRHHKYHYDLLMEEKNTPVKQLKINDMLYFAQSAKTNKYPADSLQARQTTRDITVMIVKDLQPISLVEDAGFNYFMARKDPGYPMPSRSAIKTVIDEIYVELKNDLQMFLKDSAFISITCDMWTDTMNTRSYLGVTAHCINSKFELRSYNLETRSFPERHTAQNILQQLNAVFESFDINKKITSVTTDNGADMVAAIKKGNYKHYRCYAHTLNLVVRESLLQSLDVKPILTKCKDLASLFNTSNVAANYLRSHQENRGMKAKRLKKENNTRWNSTYLMLKRISELRTILLVLLPLMKLPGNTEVPILILREFETIDEIISLLEPFENATVEMSSEKYVSLSKIIPITNCLRREIMNTEVSSTQSLKNKLIVNLLARMGDYQSNLSLQVATYLDPRFKNIDLLDHHKVKTFIKEECLTELQQIKAAEITMTEASEDGNNNINEEIDKDRLIVHSDNNNAELSGREKLWRTFDQRAKNDKAAVCEIAFIDIELRRYEQTGVVERGVNPLEWWKNEGDIFPNLKKVVPKYLARPATSVPSERVFSKSGLVLNQKRASLNPELVNKLVFLNMNL